MLTIAYRRGWYIGLSNSGTERAAERVLQG